MPAEWGVQSLLMRPYHDHYALQVALPLAVSSMLMYMRLDVVKHTPRTWQGATLGEGGAVVMGRQFWGPGVGGAGNAEVQRMLCVPCHKDDIQHSTPC